MPLLPVKDGRRVDLVENGAAIIEDMALGIGRFGLKYGLVRPGEA